MNAKRLIAVILVLILIVSMMVGCSSKNVSEKKMMSQRPLIVVMKKLSLPFGLVTRLQTVGTRR